MNELGLTKHVSYETNLYHIPSHYTGRLIGNPNMGSYNPFKSKVQNRILLKQTRFSLLTWRPPFQLRHV